MTQLSTSSTDIGMTGRPQSSEVQPRPGQEVLFEALKAMAPDPETPSDGLEPEARTALEAQQAWEDQIQEEHDEMRHGAVIPLPTDATLDALRILRGMDRIRNETLQPEHKKALATHLKDLVDRMAGQPVQVRGRGILRYR